VGSEYTEKNGFSAFEETITPESIVSLISILIIEELTEGE